MKKMTTFKKRIAILFLSVFTTLFAAFGIAFCDLSGTQDTNAGKFALDKTSITLKSKGSSELLETESESERITLLYDGQKYNGAISWTVDSDSVAAVYQGYVTALRAGETNVNAYVEENDKTYKVSCKVTVVSGIVAQVDRISAYSGSGDIDVTIGSGLMTTGASFAVKDVLDSNGASVKAQYLSENSLKNSSASPMTAGHYQVVYTLTKGDVTDEAVREINIKRADSYTDFLLVDPIDGTENITGSAIVYPWTTAADNPSPGVYVKATDEKDSITGETKAEFMQSLSDSGYDGYLSEGVPGYDTVYRMYVHKSNKTTTPYPNFFVNLVDTESALWGNLSKLPQGTQLSLWVRLTVKETGSNTYEHRRASHAYPYKVQNSGFTNYDGTLGAYSEAGGWTNFRISVSDIATKLNDARNFGVCFGAGVGALQGDVYLDIYSVELTALSSAYAPLGTYDLALSGSYTGIFDSYTFRVSDSENNVVATGSDASTVVEELAKGAYTVEYTLKRGNSELPTKTLRLLYSGVVNDLASATSITQSSWGTSNTLALDKTLAKGKPQESIVDKASCVYRNVIDTEGRDMPSFDISSVLSEIDNLDDRDYIGLWAYFEKEQITSRYVRVYLTENNGDWGSQTTGTVIFDSKTSWGGTMIDSTITFDEWTLVKVTIGELKEILAKRPDLTNINRICFQFNNLGNTGYKADYKNYRYYYYALEYFAFDPSTFEMKEQTRSIMVGNDYTLALDGFYSDAVSSWNWSSDNTAVATVDQNGKVHAVSAGTANISFTALNKTVTCAITVTKAFLFDSTDKIKDFDNGMVFTTVKADEAKGLPEGVDSTQTTYTKAELLSNKDTMQVTFDISSVLENLDGYLASDYLSLKFYNAYETYWPLVRLVTHSMYNDEMVSSGKNLSGVRVKLDNGWIELRMSVKMLREMVAAKTETTFKYLKLESWEDTAKVCYFHSWEMKHATSERFSDTNLLKFKNDNMNSSRVSATEEGIGLPQGATGDTVVKSLFKVTTGANTSFPTFDIGGVIDGLDSLSDSDYISVRLYTGTKAFWSDGQIFLTNNIDGNGATKKIEGCTHTFEDSENGGWVEVKIPVSGIKAAQADGYYCLQLTCWRNATNVTLPFYFHSWALVQAN